MRQRNVIRNLICAALTLSFALPAAAWEDDAQKAITEAAVKLIRQKYSNVFKSGGAEYYADVLRGAEDGREALRGSEILGNPSLAMERVGMEIQLLRHMNRRGTPAYFAYRMGMLSSLVSDIVLPYGLESSGAEARLRERMEFDIEKHVGTYRFPPRQSQLLNVRSPIEYFRQYRDVHTEARTLIAADYQAGVGYDGYLNNASSKFFSSSINAVLDIWNTVLTPNQTAFGAEPSPENRTWYLVDEIGYQLDEKKNSQQANHAYTYFSSVNPGIMEAYEQAGDVFYENGDVPQGVREWEFALQYSGAGRDRIITKLSEHYLMVGREALQEAQDDVKKRDGELARALHAFEKALQYKRKSREAVDLITQTNDTIRKREEKRTMILGIMTAAEKIITQAEEAAAQEEFVVSIPTYESAIEQLGIVENDFPEQFDLAQKKIEDAKSAIRSIQNDLINSAHESLAEGNNQRDERQWDNAETSYKRVEVLLEPITDQEGPFARNKIDLIEKAEEALAQLNIDRERAKAAGGGAPAAGGGGGGGAGAGGGGGAPKFTPPGGND